MKRSKAAIEVTDHAVLRWLERVNGVDINAIRRHLAGEVMAGAELGATAVRIGNHKYCLVKDGKTSSGETVVVLTTVYRNSQDEPRHVYRRAS